MKSSKESLLRAAINTPTGLPSTVEADPIFVAMTQEITNGPGLISIRSQIFKITIVIMMMDVTSSIKPEKRAETIINITNIFLPVNLCTRKTRVMSQVKNPASFIMATIIIIDIKNKMTSKEANLIKLSISTAPIRKKRPLPTKTKLKRKFQKNKVPIIDMEKIATMRDCFGEKPIK